MTLYIVEALRHGDRESHSYVVGVFNNLHEAAGVAVSHEQWRGGKYECEISKFELNKFSTEEVYDCQDQLGMKDFAEKLLTKVYEIEE